VVGFEGGGDGIGGFGAGDSADGAEQVRENVACATRLALIGVFGGQSAERVVSVVGGRGISAAGRPGLLHSPAFAIIGKIRISASGTCRSSGPVFGVVG